MRALCILLPALALSSCSLLVQFDPESQPCDTAGFCRAGYVCVLTPDGGLCKADDGGVRDAGADAGACSPRETLCGDGDDDDCDGKVDCADEDCAGLSCDDRDRCTSGETCQNGACRGGMPRVCTTPPNPCRADAGTCEPATGNCLYPALPDGISCGPEVADRCCSGECRVLSTDPSNCGGCGVACAPQQVCQSLHLSACRIEPEFTSGRCSCSASAPCPNGQSCTQGFCRPTAVTHCAPGQLVADAGFGCENYCRY